MVPVSSGFLLVQTVPGKERDVFDLLSRLPEVTARNILFRESIAVKIECPREAIDPTVSHLSKIDGVVRASLYRAKNA